jgi:dTDP-4-amino-4,6-dideoxygalactose transaminase
MKKKIWLSSPHMSEEGYELEYVHEAFRTNWIAPLGPNVNEFEKEFADIVGADYAVALSSGTAALHLALLAEGVSEGDIVFCPTLTFSASANAIRYMEAIPVFIGSDDKTWNMNPALLEEAFEKYPNVKAVVVVHLYGISAELDSIIKTCKHYNVPLIEDAAESLGCSYKGRQTGTYGDSGIFSFNGNKIITTSGGGMYVAKDPEKAQKVRFWATQSRDPAKHYQHSELGFNYRMSNVLAGIGRGQLRVLNSRVEKKRYIHEYYMKALGNLQGVGWMPENSNCLPTYWLTCITTPRNVSPTKIMQVLEENNIESRPIWKPMHLQPYFEKYECIGGALSKDLFERGICLPSDTKMTDEDLGRVCEIVKRVW